MPYRKSRPNPQTGEIESGTVLDILESSEPTIRLKLEDGTLVRVKPSIIEIMRMDEPDKDGNTAYNVSANMIFSIVPREDQENV